MFFPFYQMEKAFQLIDVETKAKSVLYNPIRSVAPTIVPGIKNLVEEKKEEITLKGRKLCCGVYGALARS